MKKKVLSLMLVLAMVMALTVPALAADSDFVIENGVLTKYNGPNGNVVIPSGVTSIGKDAFAHKEFITGVTIPDGVTSIGETAFIGCYSLTSVNIPDSVTDIGMAAFSDCFSLTSVTIPDGVTSISEGAFFNCFSLTSITIPNRVTTIGRAAFHSCNSLTSVNIPDSVTSIIENPFKGCDSLTDISVGSGNQTYTAVDGVLFSKDMTTLISYPTGRQGPYVIPDSVTTIGDYAFALCEGLTDVTIPNSVTTIGSSAFQNCDFTSITIPNSVTSMGSAFSACAYLTSVTIPGSVTTINSSTFSQCESLTSVTIMDGVTTIGRWAFDSCHSLTSVTIPASVTSIAYSAFGYCDSLTSVTIPDSITTIESSTFESCTKLTSVTIPASVTSIARAAFGGCDSLTDVYYGGSESQWKQIDIDRDNVALLKATTTIHYNSTGPDQSAESNQPTTPATNAVLSPQGLKVDGKDIDCEKYNVADRNYFKLRDLAQLLSGTGSQFEVGYDEATATVSITTGKPYTPNGTELLSGVDNSASAQPSNQAILINGEKNEELTVYNIGGSNFFQLRELGSILGFEVDYDQATNTAIVSSAEK